MKLSIITTISDPDKRQDPYLEALASYVDLADEVIVVNGGSKDIYEKIANGLNLGQIQQSKIVIIEEPWPYEWSFEQLPISLNKGLAAATGDWVIKFDIDQIVHEDSIKELRRRLSLLNTPVATMQKHSVYFQNQYTQKGEVINCINKAKFGNDIKFGDATDEQTDLCRPIWVDGKNEKGIPFGRVVKYSQAGRTGITCWNFDYTFKTADFAAKEFFRFSRAYKRYFGFTHWGESEGESFKILKQMIGGRIKDRAFKITDFNVLPKYIRKRYKEIRPSELGFNGWGVIL